MSIEHTPGPWEADSGDGYSIWRIKGNSHRNSLAEVFGDSAEADANARLIAAAPDLLAACKSALQNDEESAGFCGRNMDDGLRKELRDAIAKAEQA